MRDVLVDVRLLQDPRHAHTEMAQRASVLLGQARAALPGDALLGLADPDLPPLPDDVQAFFDGVRLAARAGVQRPPACFVQLSPFTHDPLFAARLLEDPEVVCVTVARTPTPNGEGVAERIKAAVARHWQRRYDIEVAEEQLWETVAGLSRPMARPAVNTGRRAQILVLGASCDGQLRRALASVGDIHVAGPELFTETIRPRYDRVVGVAANTARHTGVIASLARCRGVCILQDGGLLQAYAAGRRGRGRKLAEAELRRAVAPEEFARWIAGDTFPRARLLGEVAGAAETLLVHSEALARAIASVYGRTASVLPVPLSETGTALGGQRSEVPGAGQLLAAFAAGPMAESCIWMLDMLRHWGVPAHLQVFGSDASDWERLQGLSVRLGLVDRVTLMPGEPAGDESAADAVIFLGMRGHVACAATLAGAAGRGFPCVASESVAEPFSQPAWVRTVPDVPSPVLLAEATSAVLSRTGDPEEVRLWHARNAPQSLARDLAEALGLG